MTSVRLRLLFLLIALTLSGVPIADAYAARQPARGGRSARAPAQPAEAAPVRLEDPNARDTRQRLHELLQQYPPSLAEVLRLDPSLLTDADYLAPYAALAAFLAQHPEVAHNPAFFLGSFRAQWADSDSAALRAWREVIAGVAGALAFAAVLGLVIWLVRTVIDHRRWVRVSTVQTEAHTKLLDRFTSNEDLLAYIQTPAGQRFLLSAPIAVDAGPRTIGAPIGRILWSVQAGLVLAAGGIGLQLAANEVIDTVRLPLWLVGALALALGAGFVISAIVSYIISRRLGLFEPLASVPPGESRGAPGA
jgi:hypothetical protein